MPGLKQPKHGGDVSLAAQSCGRDPSTILDFSANIHPWGAPPGVLDAAAGAVRQAGRYPDPTGEPLRSWISARVGAEVVLGNGASELLRAAMHGVRHASCYAPSYLGYPEAAWPIPVRYRRWGEPDAPHGETGTDTSDVSVHEPSPVTGLQGSDTACDTTEVLVVGRPNNPDGQLVTVDEVAALRRPGRRVVVDESFLGFTGAPSCVGLKDVVVVTSLTKIFGIPGLRLGWATGLDPRWIPPWTVSGPALAAGLACRDRWDWAREVPIDAWRDDLAEGLRACPRVAAVTGAANFLLVTLRAPEGPALRTRMMADHGVLIRDASNFTGLNEHHVRVAVRTPAENDRLLGALR